MDGGERWEEILSAAGEIFEQKGYEAASLQDIASAVGILKGSMYYYIKTKEDLLYELVRRSLAVRLPTLDEDEELRATPAPMRLAEFIRRWMAADVWNRVAEQEFRKLRGRRLRAVIDRRDRFSAFVKSIIVQGVKEGSFDPTVDPSVATNTIFELMNTSRMWYQPTGRLSMADIGDWYATFVVRGLGGPDWSSHGAGIVVPRTQHRLRAAEARSAS